MVKTDLLSNESWSPQQEHALAEVGKWLKAPPKSSPQIFRLFGFAGTGKTTLAKEIATMVKGMVLFATFTGKAALVLQSKGCDGASTLHSLLYIAKQDPITGEVEFKRNWESDLASAKLLIVDEVSMVDDDLAKDILSFGKKILVLGDPFQLPPIKGTGFFINAKPDVMLTEVHRQAEDNPIIWLSMQIREGKPLQPGQYDDTVLIDRNNCDRQEVWDKLTNADQLICGLNRTRTHANGSIRRKAGLIMEGDPNAWMPVIGDRVICLRNNREHALFNGMLFNVLDAEAETHNRLPGVKMRVKSLDQLDRAPLDVHTPREFFEGKESNLDWKAIIQHQQFTFGWAITCHKSQGSQWGHVSIIDEAEVFREEAAKWRYTALTRAAERATMVL